ncbi:MAG TPA: MXAN_5808 family serine peptidase [Polyangia bacterium]|jgi:carboxyl-terminal processing protease
MDYFVRDRSQREILMRRYGKPLLVLAALVAALFLTIFRTGPVGTVLAGAEGPSRAAADPSARSYDLTALRILNMTLVRIKDNYVDPTRIDPKGMLLKALDNVQKNVAEVLVEPHPEKNQVTVRVDVAQRTFNIDGVDSPWALSAKLREIFRFIQGNLHSTSDTREIEYSAINGMLQTLDPHSLLLDPESYSEMRIQTKGSFGGLGMVLSIRKNQLTIINPMKDTPAWGAGFKAGDRIVRINEESTANMTLTEAVNRLRGEPGTKVIVWTERDGWKEPRRNVLTRDLIQVHSVESRVLHSPYGPVGYVKLKQFQGNSADDLRRALRELHSKGVKGLVLDLRFNPGGLLDQAIKVSDTFVETGTLVTTVGFAGKQREEKRATGNGIDPSTPMAVLVNGGSASASEIVAGALKNLDRAVVIGTPTFGKGSVQVLYDNDDNSALKLTIAQYLTPGDVSIQSVGIQPDILTVPMRVPAQLKSWCDAVSLYRTSHWMRESDLDQHLTSKGVRQGDKPLETLRFFDPPKPVTGVAAKAACEDREDDEADPDEPEPPPPDDDKFVEDFDIQLGRDLVAQAQTHRRRDLLAAAKGFFGRRRAEEADKTAQALQKLGIDWTAAPGAGKPQLTATLQSDKPQNQVRAGELLRLRATVRNNGPVAAGQVVGKIESDDGLFKDRELVFGKIRAGETRTFELMVKVPKDAYTRIDPLKVTFRDEHGAVPAVAQLPVKITGMPRPLFGYSYQVVDDQGGNGNGLIEAGERIRLLVTVKNLGEGRSFKPQATLKNDSGEGVDIGKGRFDFNALQPGETRTVDFSFKVAKDFRAPNVQITLAVVDRTLREIVSDKIKFPLATDAPAEQPATGTVTVAAARGAEVRGGASAKSPVIGTAARGAVFKQTARFGDFARVELEAGRPGFILATVITAGGQLPAAVAGPGAPVGYVPVLQVSPPRITIEPGALQTTEPIYHLRGEAIDDTKVADMYVFIANRKAKVEWRKVAYRSNRNGADPRRLKFAMDIPLLPGVNQVTVFARQSDNVQARQTIIVTRTGGAQAAAPTDEAQRQAAGGF